MRILFISTPYRGHVAPSLNVVEHLVNMGHTVSYLLTPSWREEIENRGASFIPYPKTIKLTPMIRAAYFTALKISDEYDIIVYDLLFFLGKELSIATQKPVVRLFSSTAINPSIMADSMLSGGFMGIYRSRFIRRRWTKKVLRGIDTSIDDWTVEVASNPPECNIVFVSEEFQPELETFPRGIFHFVGPSISENKTKVEIPFSKLPNPIIYIAMGTISNRQKAFYKMCFEAFKDEKVSVILSICSRISARSLSNIPPNFQVYPFVNQQKVLKQSDIFITHGGMNSINEAMCAGVPMLVIPIANDQPKNAELVCKLKLGLRLNKKTMNAYSIIDAAMHLLADHTIRQNAKNMSEKLKNIDGGKLAALVIEDYARNHITKQQ